MKNKIGWVYIIRAKSSGLCKIGWSSNPLNRFKIIKREINDGIEIIKMFPSNHCTVVEQNIFHEVFKDKRKHGEWFELNEIDIGGIKNLDMEQFIEIKEG